MAHRSWQRPENLLLLMALVMPLAFSSWQALLNNFTIEAAQFTGAEIGMLQSLREVPGFLAFTAVFVLLVLREQTFALIALLFLTAGVAVTGFFPSVLGLYVTTVLMSVGFHYYETINQSLTLQWIKKEDTPRFLGRMLSVKALVALVVYGGIWLLIEIFAWPYKSIYLLFGGTALLVVIAIAVAFPHFTDGAVQHKKIILRKRYGLYYLLTFLSGARRQIFMVFAGFMMVEKFGYSAADISALFLINYLFNLLFAERIGAWIGRVGERRALTVEYTGLILVFAGYAVVDNATAAAALYVIDHLFFALAIAIKTYFQKIADPRDMASTASVSFTINHIAAVVLPALLGMVWLVSPGAVFWFGTGLAACSLICARLVPVLPEAGAEIQWPAFVSPRLSAEKLSAEK